MSTELQTPRRAHPSATSSSGGRPARRRWSSALVHLRFGLPVAVRASAAIGLFVVAAAVIGVLAVTSTLWALVVAVAVLAIAACMIDLSIVAVLAFPATLLMMRVGGALSLSDVVLAGATVPCLLLIRFREAAELKPLIWVAVIYQAMILPTVLWTPYLSNSIEWVHEAFLVIGNLIVGFVAGRRGHARVSLNLYAVGCFGVAVASVVIVLVWLARDGEFIPAYIPTMQKNFIGDMLAFTFLIAFLRPPWLGWSRRTSAVLMVVTAVGIAAAQSRQAIISIVVALVVVGLRGRTADSRRARVLLLLLVPAVWVVITTVRAQLAMDDKFNSAAQRLVWYAQSVEIWKDSPLFGVGLRWWYTDRYEQFQPPNGLLEMLSSAGILGVCGFVVLCAGSLWIILRLDPRYGNVALAVLLARFVQGELDLFWVAGQGSIPWLIVGLAYGVQAYERHRDAQRRPADPPFVHEWNPALEHR